MKKILSSVVIAGLMLSATANAEGWTFLAGGQDNYTAEPTISLLVGQMSPSKSGIDNDSITGIELSLNCPLLQPPTNRIRQQVSITKYDKSGVKITNIELNPHYVVEVSPGLELGGGPGLGYVMADTPNKNPNFWGLGIGLSAHYTAMAPLFLGAEYRYQATTQESFASGQGKDNLDNSRFDIKVGYSF